VSPVTAGDRNEGLARLPLFPLVIVISTFLARWTLLAGVSVTRSRDLVRLNLLCESAHASGYILSLHCVIRILCLSHYRGVIVRKMGGLRRRCYPWLTIREGPSHRSTREVVKIADKEMVALPEVASSSNIGFVEEPYSLCRYSKVALFLESC
jgi:hypothetical protein